MSFVQRDKNGKIIGVFANPQEGYAEEEIDDTEQEVIDFLKVTDPFYELNRKVTK